MRVIDAITRASIMAGVLAQGEVPTSDDADYGMSQLNDMIDIWSIDRLAIPKRDRVGPFNMVSGTPSYTIGSGGVWVNPRPMWIDAAGVIDTISGDDVELPIRMMTIKEWARVPTKNLQSTLPRMAFYDKTYPYGTFYPYPVPNEANQIVLYVPVAVSEFTNLTTDISTPPGYRMAIISNLAVLLAMGVTDLDETVINLALSSYAAIKAANVVDQMDPMVCDSALLNYKDAAFNWFTGETI